MKVIARDVYSRIDNDLYNAGGDRWWHPDAPLNLMQSSINPTRVGYFKKVLRKLNISSQGKSALEVGCGGGILCEEIAHMGFGVTGIDPSEHSLQIAANHAKLNGLQINYVKGTGEAIPYKDNSADIVFCCDVLEHVRDVPKVISEIFRVMKPGGCFCYDTLNRTFLSKLVAINIAQVWKRWAFAPDNIHAWEMFIKPDELRSILKENNLEWKEHMGMQPNVSFLKLLSYLGKRAKGVLTYRDLGEKVGMLESNNMNIMYMGYAIKNK